MSVARWVALIVGVILVVAWFFPYPDETELDWRQEDDEDEDRM